MPEQGSIGIRTHGIRSARIPWRGDEREEETGTGCPRHGLEQVVPATPMATHGHRRPDHKEGRYLIAHVHEGTMKSALLIPLAFHGPRRFGDRRSSGGWEEDEAEGRRGMGD